MATSSVGAVGRAFRAATSSSSSRANSGRSARRVSGKSSAARSKQCLPPTAELVDQCLDQLCLPIELLLLLVYGFGQCSDLGRYVVLVNWACRFERRTFEGIGRS